MILFSENLKGKKSLCNGPTNTRNNIFSSTYICQELNVASLIKRLLKVYNRCHKMCYPTAHVRLRSQHHFLFWKFHFEAVKETGIHYSLYVCSAAGPSSKKRILISSTSFVRKILHFFTYCFSGKLIVLPVIGNARHFVL